MSEKEVKVNLHTHSTLSDGGLSPDQLAFRLAQRGVIYASLTDHDTSEGSARFRETFSRLGGVSIDGIEMTVSTLIGEAHLLAYAVDIDNPSLVALLPRSSPGGPRTIGIPPIKEALNIIHAAGGAAFLAHPLHLSRDIDTLDYLLEDLLPFGLDGLEAHYAGYGKADTKKLVELASRRGLAVSCGGDFHAEGNAGQAEVMDMEEKDWIAFRDVLLSRSASGVNSGTAVPDKTKAALRENTKAGAQDKAKTKIKAEAKTGERIGAEQIVVPGRIVARVIFPALTALALFIVSFFLIIIPRDEQLILDRKKETIRELTESAVSILSEYDTLAKSGGIKLEQAQAEAVKRIRDLRYGSENKDYFWITDMFPRMILHPYRTDLEGTDLTNFRDEGGKAIFVEFVRAVTVKDESYVEYFWQWEDDPNRIVPKLSYIRRFTPWNWVIGTGIYLDDVKAQIKVLSNELVWICLIITAVLALIIIVMVRQSLMIEREKIAAENALRESKERYRALADGATEGTVIVINEDCVFANGAFLSMTAYTEKEIQLLRIQELLSGLPEPLAGTADSVTLSAFSAVECQLVKRSGERLDVLVSATRIALGSRQGFVLSVKDIAYAINGTEDSSAETLMLARQTKTEAERIETEILYRSLPVSRFATEIGFCSTLDEIDAIAEQMGTVPSHSVIARDSNGSALGIITTEDLALRTGGMLSVITGGKSAGAIMTSPLVSIEETASVDDAVTLMRKKGLERIVLRDTKNEISGIVSASDIALLHAGTMNALQGEADAASSVSELGEIAERTVHSLKILASAGAKPRNLLRSFTAVYDAMTESLAKIAIRKLGEPPAEWVFLTLGSMGRREYLPGSDQDNALVWKRGHDNLEKERDYFSALGKNICSSLEKLGLPPCPGGVMASNPPWNGEMGEWESRIASGIREPVPERLLNLEILLDFRRTAGSEEIADEMRKKIFTFMKSEPSFFIHLARSARLKKTSSAGPRSLSAANLKDAFASFTGFTRIYALDNAIYPTSTFDRLEALSDSGIIKPETRDSLMEAFDIVLTLRLNRSFGVPNPSGLKARDELLMGYATEQISLLQKKIGFDFLGSAM